MNKTPDFRAMNSHSTTKFNFCIRDYAKGKYYKVVLSNIMEFLNEMDEMKEVMTPKDVADCLQVHVKTVYQWLKDGSLEGSMLGPRSWRIRREQVYDFLRKHDLIVNIRIWGRTKLELNREVLTDQSYPKIRNHIIENNNQLWLSLKGINTRRMSKKAKLFVEIYKEYGIDVGKPDFLKKLEEEMGWSDLKHEASY